MDEVDGRDRIENEKDKDGWVSLELIKQHTTSGMIETGLNTFVFLGLLEARERVDGRVYRISGIARKIGITWKNLKLK